MVSTAIIWLVGVPGCGKTTLGRDLARALNRQFVDLDEAIATAAGHSVAEIFAVEHESGFRHRETVALHALAGAEPPHPVVACGAGVVENAANRLTLAAGTVLWLDLPVDKALERCRSQQGQRPLLADEQAYRLRLQKRLVHYQALGRAVDVNTGRDEALRRLLRAVEHSAA